MKTTMPLWANSVNLRGLYFKKPVKVTFCECLHNYWDTSGNYSIEDKGLIKSDGCVSFASDDKKEVEIWMEGVLSSFHIIKGVIGNDLP